MLRLTSTVLFLTLTSLVTAIPHCKPHHQQNSTAITVTQWYTRHDAHSTTVVSAPSSTVNAGASDDAVSSSSSSLVIAEPTSSTVAPAPNTTSSSSAAVESSAEPTQEASSSSTSEVVATPTNLAAQPSTTAIQNNASAGNATGSGSETSDPDADLLVKLHNDFRAQYGAGPVTWSNELADYAKSHATACNMEHTHGPYGENLAAGAGGGYSITDGFNAWAAEAPEYDPSNPQYSHFTQVVWKGTTEIGCAAVTCSDGTIFSGIGADSLYIMCEYNPAGNVIGQFADNVGSKSS